MTCWPMVTQGRTSPRFLRTNPSEMSEITADRGEIAVVGAGSWGTALSLILGKAGWRVRLWARRAELAAAIQNQRR